MVLIYNVPGRLSVSRSKEYKKDFKLLTTWNPFMSVAVKHYEIYQVIFFEERETSLRTFGPFFTILIVNRKLNKS